MARRFRFQACERGYTAPMKWICTSLSVALLAFYLLCQLLMIPKQEYLPFEQNSELRRHSELEHLERHDSLGVPVPSSYISMLSSLPMYSKPDCRDRNCFHFLTKADMPHFKYCMKKTGIRREPMRSMCHFINSTGRSPVALASFPGSGNTWVRGLLQEVTGICTGGIYCDTTLRQKGFPGERIASGVVLVVKTHQTDPRWTKVYYNKSTPFKYFNRLVDVPVYSSAIFIIRNPFHAIVAEWNRQQTTDSPDNHINYIGNEYFREHKNWTDFVHSQAMEWQETLLAWVVNNRNHPVLVVKYEELKVNTLEELRKMLVFLQVPYTDLQINSVVRQGYNEFQRQYQGQLFDHYTLQQRDFVNSVIRNTIQQLETHRLATLCNIYDYLQ